MLSNILLDFQWHDLINPEFYIVHGGLWLLLFVIFAETGLFAGFFLPGDSLLFVAGIYSSDLAAQVFVSGNSVIDLFILWILISVAGILGNYIGYWFGKKSGPFLYQRKDTFFYKKKYLLQANEFYTKYGGWAIVAARFVPIIRTFAPIVAGIVRMNFSRFVWFTFMGSALWIPAFIAAGYLIGNVPAIKEYLNYIMAAIILAVTIPAVTRIIIEVKKAGRDYNDKS